MTANDLPNMSTSPQPPGIPKTAASIGAAWWAAGFLVYFFSQYLPNISGPEAPVSRLDVWVAIGHDWPTILNPIDYTSTNPDGGWEYFGQRIPFIVTASVLLIAGWLPGRVLKRLLLGQIRLLRSESIVVEFGLGLSFLTLWILLCGVVGHLNPATILLPGVVAMLGQAWQLWHPRNGSGVPLDAPKIEKQRHSRAFVIGWAIAFAPFVVHIFIGGMTPSWDFDVREYHLQGPKEWFKLGRIETLEHNVYTSFPFLSEMLSLGTMVLLGDWWQGAVAGKLALTSFQFLSALCVFAICRRRAGLIPGCIAALALLSTPWTIRISLIAYAEGALTFFLISSGMTAFLAAQTNCPRQRRRLVAVTGLLAGSAMASKYPAVLSVIIPIGLFLVFTHAKTTTVDRIPNLARIAAIFTATVVCAVGPWLIRNVIDNRNPVYPLAYSVFGANDWSPQMDAKWKRAHSAPDHSIAAIPRHLNDVAVRSDWQNGFLFAFALPALLLVRHHKPVRWLWCYVAWMLVTWWAFTHRIDRFWIPVIPVLAVLCGIAWTLSSDRFWRTMMIGALFVCCIYNFGFSRLPPFGFHGGLIELSALRKMPVRQDLRVLNQTLPDHARVLMVGEAEVFDAEFAVVYNTVFDENIFQRWTSANTQLPDDEQPMKSASEVSSVLHDEGITHVYVNWSEILRYRLTYGFSKYVVPSRLTELQQAGVLDSPSVMSFMPWSSLTAQQHKEIRSWPGSEVLSDGTYWNNILLYRVLPE